MPRFALFAPVFLFAAGCSNDSGSNGSTGGSTATGGTTTAQKTAVDSSGNIYVLGTSTGDFGSQINQGTQDVYLTKYDSAGNVVWKNLLGSSGSANGYDLALDPSGGVVVTGASTADLDKLTWDEAGRRLVDVYREVRKRKVA